MDLGTNQSTIEGYDTSLLGSFFGYPTFREKFGHQLADGSYQLSASWQSGLQNGVQVSLPAF